MKANRRFCTAESRPGRQVDYTYVYWNQEDFMRGGIDRFHDPTGIYGIIYATN